MFARAKAAEQRGPTTVGRCCRAALIGFVATTAISHAAAPDVESISPRALRPGIPVEVKFSGSGLSEVTNVRASFPGKFQPLGEGSFRITTSSNEPVGIGTLCLFGSNGVSALNFIMIDDLATVLESRTNKTRAAAQRIGPGTAVEGRCEELSYDWFSVPAKKGQRIALEVVATRLGSRLDSVLRVFDSAGKQIAQNDDAPGLRGDSFVDFKAPGDGEYFVELRDVGYAGGADAFYRLRVGDFQLATTVYPPAALRAANNVFRLAGPSGEVGRVEAAPTNAGVFPLAVKNKNGSAFAKVLVTDAGREVVEREPNDSASQAMKVTVADGINACFDKAGDRDCYEFAVRKGERLEFRAATRSLGAPCDAVLELQSADGKTLARSNPTAADEGVVTHKFASNGTYRLVVEEATGASGRNCLYRIISQPAAGFALSLETDRFNVEPGKAFDVKVNIARGEFKGPVRLALDGMDSWTWTNNVIAEGKSNVTMKVIVPENFPAEVPRSFSVVGTAERDGREVRVRASTAPALRRRFPQMLHVPPGMDGEVTLGIISK